MSVDAAPPPRKRSGEDRRFARAAARLGVVQALYQMEMTGGSRASVQAEFEAHRLGAEIDGEAYREADRKHFRDVLKGVVEHQASLDHEIDTMLARDWSMTRIDPTLRALLRAASYEIVHREDIPARAAISEYVDVAKAFFTGDEPKFVNAALDAIARRHRSGMAVR